jgi:hypothetical protein
MRRFDVQTVSARVQVGGRLPPMRHLLPRSMLQLDEVAEVSSSDGTTHARLS